MKKILLQCGLVMSLIIPLQALALLPINEGRSFLTEKFYPPGKIAYAWKVCKFNYEKWFCGSKSGLGISNVGSKEEALKKADDMITQNKDTFPFAEWKLKYIAFSGSSNKPDKCIIEGPGNCDEKVQVYDYAPFWCGFGPTIRTPLAAHDKSFQAEEADTQIKATNQLAPKANGDPYTVMCTQGIGSSTKPNLLLAKPNIELESSDPIYKIIKVTNIEQFGSSVRYSCEFVSSPIEVTPLKNDCYTEMKWVSRDPSNLYFVVPGNIAAYIRIKAVRVHDPLMFINNGGDKVPPPEGIPIPGAFTTDLTGKVEPAIKRPIELFSNDLFLAPYQLRDPIITVRSSDNKSEIGSISNIDKNARYRCMFAPGEDANGNALPPPPTDTKDYTEGYDCLSRNSDNSLAIITNSGNNHGSFIVPYGLSKQYFAIQAQVGMQRTQTYVANFSNPILLKGILETPQIVITSSSYDGKAKSGKVLNPSISDMVNYECVYNFRVGSGLCTVAKTETGNVTFTVDPKLNGYIVAIKVTATVNGLYSEKVSNSIVLQDEKKDNCSYTAVIGDAKSDGTRCNPFPPCSAPKPEDFSINFFYPRFEVNFHSKRTPNTLMELQNFDGTKSIGQTNPWISFVSDIINTNDQAKPTYFDYRMYNICENGERSKECCQVRVYKDNPDGTKTPPDICKQQCTSPKTL